MSSINTMTMLGAPSGALTENGGGASALRASSSVIFGNSGSGTGRTVRSSVPRALVTFGRSEPPVQPISISNKLKWTDTRHCLMFNVGLQSRERIIGVFSAVSEPPRLHDSTYRQESSQAGGVRFGSLSAGRHPTNSPAALECILLKTSRVRDASSPLNANYLETACHFGPERATVRARGCRRAVPRNTLCMLSRNRRRARSLTEALPR